MDLKTSLRVSRFDILEAFLKIITEESGMNEKARWVLVAIYAMAMAWVEAAVVVYLRMLIGRIQPYQPNPLPVSVGLGEIELVREAATCIMLISVGWLAGRTWRSRASYAMVAFGMWDIFYYVFLPVMSGWPRSLLDWDILFLLPLPWWGPVLAPILIAVLLVGYGTLVSQFGQPEEPLWTNRLTLGISLIGTLLALYAFMADSLRAAGNGITAIRNVLPVSFDWPVYLVAVMLMAAPLVDVSRQLVARRSQLKIEEASI